MFLFVSLFYVFFSPYVISTHLFPFFSSLLAFLFSIFHFMCYFSLFPFSSLEFSCLFHCIILFFFLVFFLILCFLFPPFISLLVSCSIYVLSLSFSLASSCFLFSVFHHISYFSLPRRTRICVGLISSFFISYGIVSSALLCFDVLTVLSLSPERGRPQC